MGPAGSLQKAWSQDGGDKSDFKWNQEYFRAILANVPGTGIPLREVNPGGNSARPGAALPHHAAARELGQRAACRWEPHTINLQMRLFRC